MKHKIGDVVYIKNGEFEGESNDDEYILMSDAILIITGFKSGNGKKYNYYVCDVYICSKRRWEKEQLFLDKAYDDDFLPLTDPTFFKEAIKTTFEDWK